MLTFYFLSDALLLSKLKFAAQELNLREHLVNRTVLYSACDVEGHKGMYVSSLVRAINAHLDVLKRCLVAVIVHCICCPVYLLFIQP